MTSDYRSGETEDEVAYENSFTCIPAALPYRPARVTKKPVVPGAQTAVVVGPKGEELYTDKYGRVKVQFHWDREGKQDQNSSCWVRVAQPIAGSRWGTSYWPRIGQEVIVAFLEGDPDQPIIVGSVYNSDQMPPYLGNGPDPKHKDDNKVSGFMSNSTKGGGGSNEWRFDDTKGKEQIFVHAQYDMETAVEHDDKQTVHNNRTIDVDGTHTETIKKDTSITIAEGKYSHDVAASTATYHVKGALTENYDDSQTTTVKGAVTEHYNATQATTVKGNIDITSSEGNITITAANMITLQIGSSWIILDSEGHITLQGDYINLIGSTLVKSFAPTVEAVGTESAKMGVARQIMACSLDKVEVTGKAITSQADHIHELIGKLIKLN